MALITTVKNFIVPDPENFPKLERDSLILTGTRALFDFDRSYTVSGADTLPAGSKIHSLTRNPVDGSVNRGSFSEIKINHGLLGVESSSQVVGLPECFDFRTLGDNPKILLQFWITVDSNKSTTGGYNSVAAFTEYSASETTQWYFSSTADNQYLQFSVAGRGTGRHLEDLGLEYDKPQLVSAVIEARNDHAIVTHYLGDSVIDSSTGGVGAFVELRQKYLQGI